MNSGNTQNGSLRRGFSPLGIWAFSIGTSIGWGSFIVTCSAYLQKAGILGSAFGLLIGMAVILVIAWNLQYMIRQSPDAGGIYTFARRIIGKDFGFLAAWFVLLTYLAILWANITSVPLFARFFFGNTFRFGFHYQIFGCEVWFGEALLSICAVLLIALLCSRGSSRLHNRVMIAAAFVFTIGFTVCAVLAVLRHESAFSYSPLYAEGSDAFGQIVRIAAISPWAFIGFENVAHFSEEYSFPVRKIRSILLWSVFVTTALYIFLSLLSVSAYPPEYASWMDYIRDMGNLSGIRAVPAFYAAGHYLGQTGVAVLMLALFGVILTSLIGNMLAISRLLYAAGREGEAPEALKKLNRHGNPENAVFLAAFVSVFIPFLGRTAVGWIVDVTTLGATIIYAMISYTVYKHARRAKTRREQYTGIIGLVLMGAFLLLLLIPGLLPFHAMETESYILFIIWSVLGLIYYSRLVRRDQQRGHGRRVVVWLILLMLVLFASMMWVSRVTENAAARAANHIFEYHESHPTDDSDETVREERIVFLREQAKEISRTNILYTVVSLGLFLLSSMILLNNYRETRALGKKLSDAEEAARVARKIADLRASISALMNNMPGMSFSKDAKTGVYLACNQAFAESAHKETPEGVLGLTDAEIFDPETAARIAADDQLALSMDEPYIFLEDVSDAAGNRRPLQTTKLKYTDDDGRLCVLGLCQDVTELVRIRRENATTKEAYEKARSTGIMYNHIAQTLAHSYMDLYYVNLETETFIKYLTNDDKGMLTEESRGEHFFEKCREDAELFVYPEDRAAIINALNRKTLLKALDRDKTFITTYRLLTDGEPVYVSMRVSRMLDDERFLVIGVTNVDQEMKQRRLAERVNEERIAYNRLSALAGDFICVYVVIPETGIYREFSATDDYKYFEQAKEGLDFFSSTRKSVVKYAYPEDLDRFMSLFTREKVLAEIERKGIFMITYRLMINGRPNYVQLKAAMVNEKEGRRLIVGVSDIDANVRQEEEYARRLAQAQNKANIDALTGVKNKYAFLNAEEELNGKIAEHCPPAFAVTILDINDLKKVNDELGHQAGDQYLRDACGIICAIFKHSPVFRIGGDEFAVISQREDYAHIEELIGKVRDHNTKAAQSGGIIIACGMAKYRNENSVTPVFEQADFLMYENKKELKSKARG